MYRFDFDHFTDSCQYTLYPDQLMYGRLLFLVVFNIPPVSNAGRLFSMPTKYQLAYVRGCRLLHPGDATLETVEFVEMENTPVFIDVRTIEGPIGRVRTEKGWAIIERSPRWARTVFTPVDMDNTSDGD
jgi:hypothetical protein